MRYYQARYYQVRYYQVRYYQARYYQARYYQARYYHQARHTNLSSGASTIVTIVTNVGLLMSLLVTWVTSLSNVGRNSKDKIR